MLKLEIPGGEFFDPEKNEFIVVKDYVLALEHSLVSISKWESKWCIPFLKKEAKTVEQMKDYLQCMTLTQHVDPFVYDIIIASPTLMKQVEEYINAPMTATWFNNQNKKPNQRIITNELLYCWMVMLQIPFECQKWHLNRLLTLIKVCDAENNPKKMGKRETISRNRALNAARKRQYNTKG